MLHGMKGISLLAKSCMYLFFALLAYVLFLGGETRYILETGFAAVGNLAQNFLGLATFTDPQRTTSFPQTWTIFYWAYWMRGISVLYRIHLPRKNGAADDPRRICLLRQRHLPELHYFRKLQPRTPGERKT